MSEDGEDCGNKREMAEQKLFFDDVKVGDAVPELRHELSRTDLVIYAGASGDFNPMHTDEVKAQAAGLPSVFGHGMFSAGLLAKSITDHFGIGSLRKFRVRFVKQTWPGEVLVSHNTVVAKHEPATSATSATSGTSGLADLECELANEDSEVKVAGSATVELPVRA